MKVLWSRSWVGVLLMGSAIAFGSSGTKQQDSGVLLQAAEKEQLVWGKVVATRYKNVPELTGPDTLRSIRSMLTPDCFSPGGLFDAASDAVTFLHDGEELPAGRSKEIHSFGTSILVRWEAVGGHPYTGIFQSGAEHGIIRLSYAKPPSSDVSAPGFGLKFWRDGASSVNIMAMHSLDGQPEYNMFVREFSTDLDAPAFSILNWRLNAAFTKALQKVVGEKNGKPTHLSLRHFARALPDGSDLAQADVREPFSLGFVPTHAAKELMTGTADFRHQLDGKGANTVLYKIFALAQEDDLNPVFVGRLVTKDVGFVASKYADAQLFFRHYSPATDSVSSAVLVEDPSASNSDGGIMIDLEL